MTIPAELLRSIPRDTVLTAAGKAVAAVTALLLFASMLVSASVFAMALRAADRSMEIEPNRAPLVVAPLALMGGAAAGLGLLFTIRRQRRLLSEGQAAIARVMKSTTRRRGNGHGTHTVHRVVYEFQLRPGGVRTGRFETQKTAPPIGGEFVVLYDPDRPERSARYPLPLVKCMQPE
jgi:hypothetical protein